MLPCPTLYDKFGRPILVGDVLKVFHFTGARKKKYFMYKQADGIVPLGKYHTPYMRINHLSMSDAHYHEKADGRILRDYEIVQGYPDFEDREKTRNEEKTGG